MKGAYTPTVTISPSSCDGVEAEGRPPGARIRAPNMH